MNVKKLLTKIIFNLFLILSIITGLIKFKAIKEKEYKKTINRWKDFSNKHLKMFYVADKWIDNIRKGIKISDRLQEQGISKIAIYGWGRLGEQIYKELERSEVQVLYAVDQNFENIYASIKVISPNEVLLPVDAIIVSAISSFEEINCNLRKRYNYKVLSLEDLIF